MLKLKSIGIQPGREVTLAVSDDGVRVTSDNGIGGLEAELPRQVAAHVFVTRLVTGASPQVAPARRGGQRPVPEALAGRRDDDRAPPTRPPSVRCPARRTSWSSCEAAVLVTDRDGNLLYANPYAVRPVRVPRRRRAPGRPVPGLPRVRGRRRAAGQRPRAAGAPRPGLGRHVRDAARRTGPGCSSGRGRPPCVDPSGAIERHRHHRPRGHHARQPQRAGPAPAAGAHRGAAGPLAGARRDAPAGRRDARAAVRRPLPDRPVPGRQAGAQGAAARPGLDARAGQLGHGRRADQLPGGALLPAGHVPPGHGRGGRPGGRAGPDAAPGEPGHLRQRRPAVGDRDAAGRPRRAARRDEPGAVRAHRARGSGTTPRTTATSSARSAAGSRSPSTTRCCSRRSAAPRSRSRPACCRTTRPRSTAWTVAYKYVPAKPLETHGQGIQTQVGGDWYDIIPLSAGRVGIVIGDVEGRGARAAAIMGQLRAALRAFAQDDKPPAEILRRLDDWCRTLEPAGRGGARRRRRRPADRRAAPTWSTTPGPGRCRSPTPATTPRC